MRKVPELVVQERMSQGKVVKGRKEKKNVPGWSIEEIREKPSVASVEDTEEMRKWKRFKPERNGPVLEEFGGKNGRGSPGQV